MKYITLEELENRKKILQDKIDRIKEKRKLIDMKKAVIEDMNYMNQISSIETQKWEVEYLIDYIKMKFFDNEEDKPKRKVCIKCKHYIKCRNLYFNSNIIMDGDYCARFEEGNIEENKKYFDKFLEKEDK